MVESIDSKLGWLGRDWETRARWETSRPSLARHSVELAISLTLETPRPSLERHSVERAIWPDKKCDLCGNTKNSS